MIPFPAVPSTALPGYDTQMWVFIDAVDSGWWRTRPCACFIGGSLEKHLVDGHGRVRAGRAGSRV